MSDFQSWEEVEAWLLEPEEYNQVYVHAWFFTAHGMTCGESNCCDDQYETIEAAMAGIQHYLHGAVWRVERV